jgi:UDPglucose--hexose-1-phosphate uridylyltransferase
MIDTVYNKELRIGKYLDPFNAFNEKEVSYEIRHDEVTDVTCHILPVRHRKSVKPEITPYLEKSPEPTCPFCPDLFEKTTPKFTPDISAEGRFQKGNASLFPNAFPHDRFNCVAIFSHKHFISLNELKAETMLDGFRVCGDYFQRMKEVNPALRFCSINWNYMPPAGGGLIHPHVQTVIEEKPSHFVAAITQKANSYREATGGNLWADLIAYEKYIDERFIASTGNIEWIASFAPRGMAGEIWFVFNGKKSIFKLIDEDFHELLTGFSRLFRFFDEKNFISFNMTLFATLVEDDNLWVQGRLLPRFVILPLGTSDVNYFEKLHNEILCTVNPEEMCKELKCLF